MTVRGNHPFELATVILGELLDDGPKMPGIAAEANAPITGSTRASVGFDRLAFAAAS